MNKCTQPKVPNIKLGQRPKPVVSTVSQRVYLRAAIKQLHLAINDTDVKMYEKDLLDALAFIRKAAPPSRFKPRG